MKKFLIFLFLLFGPFIALIAITTSYSEFEFLVTTIILLMWLYLSFWLIRGTWRFLFQPPGEDSWRFQGIEGPAFAPLITQYHYGHSFDSSAGLRAVWLKDKIKNTSNKRKSKKWQKELDKLSENYDLKKNIETVRRVEKTRKDIISKRVAVEKYGVSAPKIICPHCNVTGQVWRNENAKTEERSREQGVIGAVIGRKTITEKKVTKLNCKNCNTSWVI
jgi:hypothetical protein